MKTFVSYVRVSRSSQGIDGLGIAAQLEAVNRYISSQGPETATVGDFRECESGKKTDKERPQLKAALDLCKKTKSTLVVAKLDRLSRNAEFLLSLQNANVDFVCTDSPNVDRFTVGILALVAQRERELIGLRTKSALAVLKSRGVKLGNPNHVQSVKTMNDAATAAATDFRKEIIPIIAEIKKTGVKTFKALAQCLNARGIQTRQGKGWSTSSVRNIMLPS